ncbi:MAG: hypothetical protein A3A44_00010 [Candidatus Sungbacteria bacterium RIFCSPLOWO2_01_FULL_60_25]|uniref:AB hydrolase-1 domain-containing protein n=1 Tax=Candidatus Sungbacteria bacterium RIFCSPLOWO2_01_FULL_60_25 TaxID=1802281 RepID=A0A1G2LDM2_9BACT|nr:MAG: hypothetical protein A3A44_00010 [Candidatus Sungbacteria bacterium RIFCSPLOWO2_01_FULL_60_25]
MTVLIISGFLQPLIRPGLYRRLAARLAEAGFSPVIVDLGWNVRGVQATAARIAEAFPQGQPFTVVAHSFGGVALRHLLATRPAVGEDIAKIAFVAVPHSGTWSSMLFAWLPAGRDMLPGRAHFRVMARVMTSPRMHTFVAEHDWKIVPARSQVLPGVPSTTIPGTGHDSIVQSEQFADEVIQFLNTP